MGKSGKAWKSKHWGTMVNGKMSHSGPCFRCKSKGKVNIKDCVRNRSYDNNRTIH